MEGIKMEFTIEKKESFQIMGLSDYEYEDTERNEEITGVWVEFTAEYDKKLMDYYTAPYWQVGAIDYSSKDGKKKIIVGGEYKGKMLEGMSIETIPAGTWAVFTFDYPAGFSYYVENLNKILTEWLPASEYKHDEEAMLLEVYFERWQLWIPVVKK